MTAAFGDPRSASFDNAFAVRRKCGDDRRMRNHHAAVTRRLSDPDFQAALVNRCLALTLGIGVLLGISLIHDAYVWMNPV